MCTRASNQTRKNTRTHKLYRQANKTREEEEEEEEKEEEATTKLTMTTDSFDNCTTQIEKKKIL